MPYPLTKAVAELWKQLQRAATAMETMSFPSLNAAMYFDGLHSRTDVAYDFKAALAQLAHDGKVRIAPDGSFEILDRSSLPPQHVAVPLPTPLAPLRDRYRASLEEMTAAYSQLFLMENGLRAVIAHTLSGLDPDWWSKRVPPDVQANAATNFRSDARKVKYRLPDQWDQLSPEQRLDFTDFSMLGAILLAPDNWPHFEKALQIDNGLAGRLKELEPLRNAVAHMRALSKDDFETLRVHARQVAGAVSRL